MLFLKFLLSYYNVFTMLPILLWLRVSVPKDLENWIRALDIRLISGFDSILETHRWASKHW